MGTALKFMQCWPASFTTKLKVVQLVVAHVFPEFDVHAFVAHKKECSRQGVTHTASSVTRISPGLKPNIQMM